MSLIDPIRPEDCIGLTRNQVASVVRGGPQFHAAVRRRAVALEVRRRVDAGQTVPAGVEPMLVQDMYAHALEQGARWEKPEGGW